MRLVTRIDRLESCQVVRIPSPAALELMPPKETPWGEADRIIVKAPGLVWVTTPSHGGFWLSPERVAQFRERLPGYQPFAGFPWLEEDEDSLAAIAVWPLLFDARDVHTLVRAWTFRAGRNDWHKNPEERARSDRRDLRRQEYLTPELRAIAAEWHAANYELWEPGGGGTHYDKARGRCDWDQYFTQIGSGAHRTVRFHGYPNTSAHPLWTTAELDEAEHSRPTMSGFSYETM
jgi:hypothetical protein